MASISGGKTSLAQEKVIVSEAGLLSLRSHVLIFAIR